MRNIILLLFIVGFIISCEKDRANWDPTPEISSIEIVQSQLDPMNIIELTDKNESWGLLLIHGQGFKDNLVSVNEIQAIKDGHNLGCDIYEITATEIKCLLSDLNYYVWAGAGNYYISVKMPDSDWSNSIPVTVY